LEILYSKKFLKLTPKVNFILLREKRFLKPWKPISKDKLPVDLYVNDRIMIGVFYKLTINFNAIVQKKEFRKKRLLSILFL
jgi:hypothetical protein